MLKREKNKKILAGFTLIEMLLVLVIISSVIFMGTNYIRQKTTALRIDTAALQMQQILNAALAYYVANGSWPAGGIGGANSASTSNSLQGGNYLPNNFSLVSPWGGVYYGQATTSNFYTIGSVTGSDAYVTAQIIAGKLPFGYTTATTPTSAATVTNPPTVTECTSASTTCYVVASVTIPGQNLNNATSINYAGLYHNGACVQVPTCPAGTTPQIFVVPASVHGANDQTASGNIYPLSSFTAYATGTGTGNGPNPTHCSNKAVSESYAPQDDTCYQTGPGQTGTQITSGDYWRVCLNVITQKGMVSWDNGLSDNSGHYTGTILAVTRCAISNENSQNSQFNVYAR